MQYTVADFDKGSIWLEFLTVKRFLGHRVLACDFVFPLYIKVCLVNAILQWFYDLFWLLWLMWIRVLLCTITLLSHVFCTHFFVKPFVRVRIVNVTYRKQFYDVLILHFLSLWLDACFMFVFFITNLCRSLLYNCASFWLNCFWPLQNLLCVFRQIFFFNKSV